MAWIEVHLSLFTHRKTIELAELLGLPEVYAAAHLVALWSWALDNAPDATLPISARIIAKASQWPADPDAFVEALLEAGFLDAEGDRCLIHDWQEYAGKLIDQRKANAERQKEWRDRHKNARKSPAPPVTPTSHERNGGRNATVTVTSPLRNGATSNGATVPNPTQPNPTEPLADSHAEHPDAPEAATATATEEVDNFKVFADEVWELYPERRGKKLGKQKCIDELRKVPSRDWDAVLLGVQNFRKSRQALEGFAPDAFRWLRDGVWRDWQEPERHVSNGHVNGNGASKPRAAPPPVYQGLDPKEYTEPGGKWYHLTHPPEPKVIRRGGTGIGSNDNKHGGN